MYRRRRELNPISYFAIFILIIAYMIFSSFTQGPDPMDITDKITVIEESGNTLKVEINND
tara:strand:- start:346 stop:525 length:180 start_codon:yes stop_codon:yes gene_type:complete